MTNPLSRQLFNHPVQGAPGDATLYSEIEAIFQAIGDSNPFRWFLAPALANTSVGALAHGLRCAFSELTFRVYTYTGTFTPGTTELTRVTTGFTTAATSGSATTSTDFTNTSGGTLSYAILVCQARFAEQLSDLSDINFGTPAVDGQALVFNGSTSKWVPGASGDASFKLQSITSDVLTLKGGHIILGDGRELATFDGSSTYGGDITASLLTLNAAPANGTTYYLYVDLDSLPAAVLDESVNRKIYGVTVSNLVLSTTTPDQQNRARYVPLGLVVGIASSHYSTSLFKTLATRVGQNNPSAVSPVVYSLAKQIIGAIGTSTAGAGHQLSARSFNPNLAGANVDWFNLTSASDGSSNARDLTNTGTVVFTGTGILGDSNGAASFGGANRLSSTNAAFNPSTAFAIALWAKPTGVSGTQTLAATQRVSGGSTTNFWLRMNTTTLEILDSTAAVILSVASAFAAGTWVHVAFRYDGTNGYAYINGKLAAGPVAFTPSAVASPEFDVGANNPAGTPANFYTGLIDELAFASGSMSDTDILKLYGSRLDHSAGVSVTNQEWIGNIYTDSDTAAQLPVSGPSGVIIDKSDSNSLFLDLSAFNAGTDSVELKLKDTGLSPTVITPVPPYDVTYTSTPSSPVAHGQPDIPDVVLMVETGTAGQWEQMPTEGKILVDATNLTIDLSSLSPAVGVSPNRVRIIARPARLASVGVPDATTARSGTIKLKAPTRQTLLSGSGTYTLPAGVLRIKLKMLGGGGGGSGSGTATAAGINGSNGGDSTFGSSLLTAAKGIGGQWNSAASAGGAATVNSPAIGFGITGGWGQPGAIVGSAAGSNSPSGAYGAPSAFGGAGAGGVSGGAGQAASTNSGAGGGGGGGGSTGTEIAGNSGSAAAYLEADIGAPLATYSYAVGGSGGGGNAGTNGFAGGAGGSGIIIVEEYYY